MQVIHTHEIKDSEAINEFLKNSLNSLREIQEEYGTRGFLCSRIHHVDGKSNYYTSNFDFDIKVTDFAKITQFLACANAAEFGRLCVYHHDRNLFNLRISIPDFSTVHGVILEQLQSYFYELKIGVRNTLSLAIRYGLIDEKKPSDGQADE